MEQFRARVKNRKMKTAKLAEKRYWRARDSCPTVGALTLMHDIGLAHPWYPVQYP